MFSRTSDQIMTEAVRTYDKNHKIIFKKEREHVSLLMRKCTKDEFNRDMQKRVLEAYNLTEESLQRYDTDQKLNTYMVTVAKEVGCNATHLRKNGIAHLLECKGKKSDRPALTRDRQDIKIKLENLVKNIVKKYAKVEVSDRKESSLPLLQATMEISKEYYQCEPAINKTLIILVQQGFATVIQTVNALISFGVPKENIILTTKPHTTDANTRRKLSQFLGANYIEPELVRFTGQSYEVAQSEAIIRLIVYVKTCLLQPDKLNIKNIILHDEGGKVVRELNKESPENLDKSSPNMKWKINRKTYSLSISEHTTCGASVYSLAAIPHVSMAGSQIKTKIESYLVAESCFQRIEEILRNKIERASSSQKLIIGVIGCGNIGFEFIKLLINKFKNFDLKITDRATEKLQIIQEFYNGHAHRNRITLIATCDDANKIIASSDIVFGATGVDVTKRLRHYLESHPSSIRHSTTLYSISSGRREFKTLFDAINSANELDAVPAQYEDLESQYNMYKLILKNGGLPINFDGKDYAITPFKEQITRALSFSTIVQQLHHLTLVEQIGESACHEINSIIKLNSFMQLYIWKTFEYSHRYLADEHSEKLSKEWFCQYRALMSIDRILAESSGDEAAAVVPLDYHSQPRIKNIIGQYDHQHAIHLLRYSSGEWEFCCVKNGKKIAPDVSMIDTFLSRYHFNLHAFNLASDFEKIKFVANTWVSFHRSSFPSSASSAAEAHGLRLTTLSAT